jgi:hypothetical protein
MRTRNRGVSTVVDVALFLLLVSAAVLSVATAGVHDRDVVTTGSDEATVETLATSTATVRYDLARDRRTNETIERVRHGSLAELLAEAAVASAAVGGERISPYPEGFAAAVGEAVRPALDGRTRVAATWTPYPGSHLRGRVTVGPSPPPDARVHAATLAVDSGLPAARDTAVDAAPIGYGRVAGVVARHAVEGLFPPRRTRVALDGGTVDAAVTHARFERAAAAYGSEATLEEGVTPATDGLAIAMSKRMETELRDRYETPQAAASSVRTGRVTIVVRTWS